MRRIFIGVVFIISIIGLIFVGCGEVNHYNANKARPEMVFYVGSTMVKPISVLVDHFEKNKNCRIKIIQGGSQALYERLKKGKNGDLYVPETFQYRKDNLEEGILKESVLVGYNKAVMLVKKGNPLGIDGGLFQLSNPDNKVVICNPDSSAIGEETKKILGKYGRFQEVLSNTSLLARNFMEMIEAIESEKVDVGIGWYAITVWRENKEKIEAIEIEGNYVQKKKITMSLVDYSKEKELVKDFMEYATSRDGRQTFKKFGFLDEDDINKLMEVSFGHMLSN